MQYSEAMLNFDLEYCFSFNTWPCGHDTTTSRRFGDDGNDSQKNKKWRLEDDGYESKSYQRVDG